MFLVNAKDDPAPKNQNFGGNQIPRTLPEANKAIEQHYIYIGMIALMLQS